jgi:hypothetical protein
MSRTTAVVGKPHRLLSVGLACVLALGLSAGCTKRGSAERIGEKIDHTVDTIKNGGHEPVGDSIKDDVNKARDKISDAVDDAKDKH